MASMRPLISRVVAIAMLGVYLLLPAAAWVHEEIEHACVDHAASHDPSDHDSEKHHDSSHCQICLTIHASAKQDNASQPLRISTPQRCGLASCTDDGQLFWSELPSSQSPRGPPIS
jgi:hypothetical protein